MKFADKLEKVVVKNNSLLCIGLDSDFAKIPKHLKKLNHPIFEFNKAIIERTSDLVSCYKPNLAFYQARGERGIKELKLTIDYLKTKYPDVVIILDAKLADIGNTNNGYVEFVFDYLGADAVTLHPYLGSEALLPFLTRADKGCIILCRTSNSGAGELQDLKVEGEPLYKIIARKVVGEWNTNNNCLLVVGATYPQELSEIRQIAGEMTFLVPGVGAQGGSVETVVKAGLNSKKTGIIVSSSRSIIFADSGENFATVARAQAKALRDEINNYRN